MNDETGQNTSRRYPMSFKLRYVTQPISTERTGAGETVWMSRNEVAFLSKAPAVVGEKIQLFIAWPVLLHGMVPLQLIVNAEVVQSSGPLTVVKLTTHEFRTRGVQSAPMGTRSWVPVPDPELYPSRRMPYLGTVAPARTVRVASAAFR